MSRPMETFYKFIWAQMTTYSGEQDLKCSLKLNFLKRHNNIRNKKSNIITDMEVIFRMIREYYEQIYANIFENLDEVDAFI